MDATNTVHVKCETCWQTYPLTMTVTGHHVCREGHVHATVILGVDELLLLRLWAEPHVGPIRPCRRP